MGQNVNAQLNEKSDYVCAVSKSVLSFKKFLQINKKKSLNIYILRISELVAKRMFDPLIWPMKIFNLTKYGKEHQECLKIIHGFSREVILGREKEFEENSVEFQQKRMAFLDILLKAKHDDQTITFEDIQEEVDTFMFEGHDTTAAAASWGCHLIGSHPDIQRKIHQEMDAIFGDSDRPITNNDLKEMKYLDCVIKEILRLFPSVPFFSRNVTEDFKIGDYTVLKGSNAVIFAYMIHRDEKYYPEPEKFDPDRFLPENIRNRHPYAYIPFSAGRRNCIG
jgi:cytochrome P450 family 4 subfamily V